MDPHLFQVSPIILPRFLRKLSNNTKEFAKKCNRLTHLQHNQRKGKNNNAILRVIGLSGHEERTKLKRFSVRSLMYRPSTPVPQLMLDSTASDNMAASSFRVRLPDRRLPPGGPRRQRGDPPTPLLLPQRRRRLRSCAVDLPVSQRDTPRWP